MISWHNFCLHTCVNAFIQLLCCIKHSVSLWLYNTIWTFEAHLKISEDLFIWNYIKICISLQTIWDLYSELTHFSESFTFIYPGYCIECAECVSHIYYIPPTFENQCPNAFCLKVELYTYCLVILNVTNLFCEICCFLLCQKCACAVFL